MSELAAHAAEVTFRGNQNYQLTDAPGRLAVIQDLVNSPAHPTFPGHVDDLLADVERANAWAKNAQLAAGAEVSGKLCATEADRLALIAFRDWVAGSLVTASGSADVRPPVSVEIDPVTWRLRSGATGIDGVIGEMMITLHLAVQDGTWSRLKRCANGTCPAVFYDRSRGNSGVWHSLSVCGNAVNLRNSRRRRREASAEVTPPVK